MGVARRSVSGYCRMRRWRRWWWRRRRCSDGDNIRCNERRDSGCVGDCPPTAVGRQDRKPARFRRGWRWRGLFRRYTIIPDRWSAACYGCRPDRGKKGRIRARRNYPGGFYRRRSLSRRCQQRSSRPDHYRQHPDRGRLQEIAADPDRQPRAGYPRKDCRSSGCGQRPDCRAVRHRQPSG